MRAYSTLLLWLAAGLSLVSRSAWAQAVDLTPDPLGEAQASSANAPGSYAGVKPGGEQPPPVAATPGARPAAITWPGFQMQADGSSRVFLQATAPVTTQTRNTGSQIVVELGDAKIAGDTNALPLDTRFFNTPVKRIALERKKGKLQLVLSMRTPSTPSVTSERAASGFHFIYVDFAAGNYLDESSVSAAPPPPDEPPAAKAPSQREAPSHLSGEVKASGKVDTSMDAELPPGMGKVRARGKAGTSKQKGKAGGKVEGKAGFSL